jgi:hypothetical protein
MIGDDWRCLSLGLDLNWNIIISIVFILIMFEIICCLLFYENVTPVDRYVTNH